MFGSKRLFAVYGWAMTAALLAACGAAAAPTPAPKATDTPRPAPAPTTAPAPSAVDPIAVVKAYVETANSGNYEKALAFFADDAVATLPIGLQVGKAQIGKWLTEDVKTTRATSRDVKIDGPLVVNTGSVTLARFKAAGIESVEYRNEYVITKDGKIRFFGPVVTLTPEQGKTMQAAGGPPPAPAMVNPIEVAKAYVEAANGGSYDKALAFYADDAAALVMNGALLNSGKEQIGAWLREDVKTTRAQYKDWQMSGNTVVGVGTVSLDRFAKLGFDQVQFRAEFIVVNGKLRFFRPLAILTPEQAATVQAAAPKP